MQVLKLPKAGQAMEEGVVVEWHLDEGDRVETGDPVVTFESDKATSDVHAEQDGTLLRKTVPEGRTVAIGTVLGYVGRDETELPEHGRDEATAPDDDPGPASDGTAVRTSPTARRIARERGVDVTAVSDALGVEQIRPPHIKEYVDEYRSEDEGGDGDEAGGGDTHGDVLASPLAKRIAGEEDVDIDAVGDHVGRTRVRKADVDAYLEATERAASAVEPATDSSGPAVAEERPIRGRDRVMFDRMSEVAREYAETTTVARVDVTRLWERYRSLSTAWPHAHDVEPSLTAFVVRAVADSLPSHPTLNAELTDDTTLRIYEDVNVGVAVATDEGTLVPTIRNADAHTVRELSRHVARLAADARDGALAPEALQGGTFTVSNAGTMGAYLNTPKIFPPQSAILGVCSVFDQPAVVDDEVVPRKMLHLCLTYDHRVVDGDTAVGFLQDVKALLETPDALLS